VVSDEEFAALERTGQQVQGIFPARRGQV